MQSEAAIAIATATLQWQVPTVTPAIARARFGPRYNQRAQFQPIEPPNWGYESIASLLLGMVT